MECTLEVYEGESARHWFEDPDFLAAWEELYQKCPWRTVFQSKDFVLTWYRLFSSNYSPILIKSTHHGVLTGLFTLAMSKRTALITAAGSEQAEYHAWLTEEVDGETFIVNAVLALRKKFPGYNIGFTYLPPKAPVKWVRTNPHLKGRCFVRMLKQPLIHIEPEYFTKKLNAKTIKEKVRRLQRLGDLKFERISDPDTFIHVLDELIVQYEFRKGAMYNIAPFRDEPSKKTLLIELFKLNMLHVTVLKIDDKIIASTVNTIEEKWICFKGVNAHAPHYSKQSPGLLHLLMLGKLISEEGMELFDLTPGDDFYKDKLATHYEEVMELWIARSRTACIKLKLRESVKKVIREGLTKRGFDPRVALTRMRMVKERILYLKSGFSSRKKRKTAKKQQQLYQLQPRKNLHVVLPPVQKDNVADLLLFDPKGSGMTRWEFLKDAMKRFELGEHSYTITDNGRLLACAWLRGKYSEPVGDLQGLSILPEAEIIHSVYYHPALKNWNQPFLNAVAEDVSAQLNKKGIYLVADAGNEIVSAISGPVTATISGKDSYFQ